MNDDRPLRDRVALPPARNVLGTVIRLGIACLVVGGLLAILRIDPVRLWQNIFEWIRTGAVDLFGTGLDGISLVVTLLLTGAVIVVPIWLIGKLLGMRKK